jgi:hypothetical protein
MQILIQEGPQMKDSHLLKIGILAVVASCATQIDDVESTDQSTSSGQQPGPYPSSTPTSQPKIQDQGSWVCGSEWIVVRGPNGELIVSEVPLKCDPFADTYTGDPSPIDEEK